MISYKIMRTIGTGLIIASSSFFIGVFFCFQAYDFHLLFDSQATPQHFEDALNFYKSLNDVPFPLVVILGTIYVIGLIGGVFRVAKTNPELTYFEYGSLGLYVLSICIFMTNVKTGIECTLTGAWGEVSQDQGLQVMASSNVILIVMLLGVLVLQGALWYTEYDLDVRMKEFFAREAAAKRAAAARAAQQGRRPPPPSDANTKASQTSSQSKTEEAADVSKVNSSSKSSSKSGTKTKTKSSSSKNTSKPRSESRKSK